MAPLWALLAMVGCFMLHACLGGPVRTGTGPLPGEPGPPIVTVGLSDLLEVDEVVVTCSGAMTMRAGETEGTWASGEAAEVRPATGGLWVNHVALESTEVRFRPQPGHTLTVGGLEYRGDIRVLARADGKLAVVNDVELEHYLAGVIGREMSLSWPDECLRAQAVAARSYVIASLVSAPLRAAGRPYDVFDDERSQVYRGVEAESDKARRIVEETRGMVLTADGQVLTAYYHSTCGGRTDAAWDVLPNVMRAAPLGGAECGFCDSARYFRWTARIPVAEAAGEFGARSIRSVVVSARTRAGRAKRVRIVTDAGEQEVDAMETFRARLGGRRIRSTWLIDVRVEEGELVVDGAGWGHGAGMCQMGAYGMSRQGYSAAEILARYYPGAALEKRY